MKHEDNIAIRPASFRDYRALCTIFNQSNQLHRELRPDYYRAVDPVITPFKYFLMAAFYKTPLGKRNLCVQIAEDTQGKPIGAMFAESVKRSSLNWSRHPKEAYINNIHVDENWRGNGIGTKLLQCAEAWARATNHPVLTGRIVENNENSLDLSVRNGFHRTGINIAKELK